MSTRATPPASGAPWHLWLVATVAVVANGYSAWENLLIQFNAAIYRRLDPASEAAWMDANPLWMSAIWVVAIGAGCAGSVLLLLRSRRAFWAFIVSLSALLTRMAYAIGVGGGVAVLMNPAISLVIAAAGGFFIWYAWAMSRAGVLR